MATTVIERDTMNAIQTACREYVRNSHKVDWEQRRYEIAKELFPRLLADNPAESGITCAQNTVTLTDYLIEELKK